MRGFFVSLLFIAPNILWKVSKERRRRRKRLIVSAITVKRNVWRWSYSLWHSNRLIVTFNRFELLIVFFTHFRYFQHILHPTKRDKRLSIFFSFRLKSMYPWSSREKKTHFQGWSHSEEDDTNALIHMLTVVTIQWRKKKKIQERICVLSSLSLRFEIYSSCTPVFLFLSLTVRTSKIWFARVGREVYVCVCVFSSIEQTIKH